MCAAGVHGNGAPASLDSSDNAIAACPAAQELSPTIGAPQSQRPGARGGTSRCGSGQDCNESPIAAVMPYFCPKMRLAAGEKHKAPAFAPAHQTGSLKFRSEAGYYPTWTITFAVIS